MSTLLLDLASLRLSLGNRVLIRDLSLQLHAGKRLGITGPSGYGKTTLLRNIVARDLSHPSRADRFHVTPGQIGYLPQTGGLLPWFTLQRNLEVLGSCGMSHDPERTSRLLTDFELQHLASQRPVHFSGGEMQRARLACAMAAPRALVCADEPLTEVDVRQKWRVLDRWSRLLIADNSGLVVVSHDVDTLLGMCDEIVYLHNEASELGTTPTRFSVDVAHPRVATDLTKEPLVGIRGAILRTFVDTPSRVEG
jgi:ABC-type multidrug transport system ATPase subunit